MKKHAPIILAAFLLVAAGLIYYSLTNEKTAGDEQNNITEEVEEAATKDVREAVWEQLSERQKEEIVGTWSDGEVSTVTLREGSPIRTVGDTSYDGKEVYFVSFPSKLNPTVGDVIIYADMGTFDIVGYGLRD